MLTIFGIFLMQNISSAQIPLFAPSGFEDLRPTHTITHFSSYVTTHHFHASNGYDYYVHSWSPSPTYASGFNFYNDQAGLHIQVYSNGILAGSPDLIDGFIYSINHLLNSYLGWESVEPVFMEDPNGTVYLAITYTTSLSLLQPRYEIDLYEFTSATTFQQVRGYPQVIDIINSGSDPGWIRNDVSASGNLLGVVWEKDDNVHVAKFEMTSSGLIDDGDRVDFANLTQPDIAIYTADNDDYLFFVSATNLTFDELEVHKIHNMNPILPQDYITGLFSGGEIRNPRIDAPDMKDNLTPNDRYAWSVVYEEVDPGNTMYIRSVIKDELANNTISEFCLNSNLGFSNPTLSATLEDIALVLPPPFTFVQKNFHPVVSFSNWDKPDFGDTSVYYGWSHENHNPNNFMHNTLEVFHSYIGLKVRTDGLLKLSPDDHYHHIPIYLFETTPTNIFPGMGFSGNNRSDDGLFITFFHGDLYTPLSPVPHNMINKQIPHNSSHFRPTDIRKIKTEGIIATYPNPFHRSFSLINNSGQDQKIYQLDVIDILGRLVYSAKDDLPALNTFLALETSDWIPDMSLIKLTKTINFIK